MLLLNNFMAVQLQKNLIRINSDYDNQSYQIKLIMLWYKIWDLVKSLHTSVRICVCSFNSTSSDLVSVNKLKLGY